MHGVLIAVTLLPQQHCRVVRDLAVMQVVVHPGCRAASDHDRTGKPIWPSLLGRADEKFFIRSTCIQHCCARPPSALCPLHLHQTTIMPLQLHQTTIMPLHLHQTTIMPLHLHQTTIMPCLRALCILKTCTQALVLKKPIQT